MMEEQLQGLESPFTWNVPELESKQYIFQHVNNNEDQSNFIINGFCIFIVECFERARVDEIQLAIRKAEECELELSEYSPIGLYSKSDKYVWERSHDALWHVLLATQAHLAFRNDDLELAEEKIQKIIPVDSLDEYNIAALAGIKSRFFQVYGGNNEFTEKAIEYARQAVKFDDSVPLWHFLLGKSIARRRRNMFPYERPSEEECFELQRAWEECRKPDVGVMLLQTYQTLIRHVGRRELVDMKKLIYDTIKDIISLAGNEWYIYWRCAHVCVRLPYGVIPAKEVKSIIDHAFEFSERAQNTNKKHLWEVMASYYKFIERNLEEALKYSMKAAAEGEVTCVFDVLSLNYKINGEKNLLPVINKYIDQYGAISSFKIDNLLIAKANYLMFVKEDIKEAFKIYFNLMKEKSALYQLQNCRPLFGESSRNYSLYQRLKTSLNQIIQTCDSIEDTNLYNSYLQDICNYENLLPVTDK